MTDTIQVTDPRVAAPPVAVPPSTPQAQSILDMLAADINEAVSIPPKVYPIPRLPSYELVADVNIDFELLEVWRKGSLDARGNIDQLRLAKLIIANKVTRILKDGEAATYEGRDLNFRSPELWPAVGATSAVDAVKKMIGPDGAIGAIGDAILTDAGYGSTVEGHEVERPNPTQG